MDFLAVLSTNEDNLAIAFDLKNPDSNAQNDKSLCFWWNSPYLQSTMMAVPSVNEHFGRPTTFTPDDIIICYSPLRPRYAFRLTNRPTQQPHFRHCHPPPNTGSPHRLMSQTITSRADAVGQPTNRQ
jgi:hypothetical protein